MRCRGAASASVRETSDRLRQDGNTGSRKYARDKRSEHRIAGAFGEIRANKVLAGSCGPAGCIEQTAWDLFESGRPRGQADVGCSEKVNGKFSSGRSASFVSSER